MDHGQTYRLWLSGLWWSLEIEIGVIPSFDGAMRFEISSCVGRCTCKPNEVTIRSLCKSVWPCQFCGIQIEDGQPNMLYGMSSLLDVLSEMWAGNMILSQLPCDRWDWTRSLSSLRYSSWSVAEHWQESTTTQHVNSAAATSLPATSTSLMRHSTTVEQ